MSDGSVQSNKSRIALEEQKSINEFVNKNLENIYGLLKEHKLTLVELASKADIKTEGLTNISGEEIAEGLAEQALKTEEGKAAHQAKLEILEAEAQIAQQIALLEAKKKALVINP